MPLIYLPDTDTFLDTASIEKLEPSETPADDLHDEPRLSVTVTLRNAPWMPASKRDEDPEQMAEVYEGKDAQALFDWAKVDATKTKKEVDNAMMAAALKKEKKTTSDKPATLTTDTPQPITSPITNGETLP